MSQPPDFVLFLGRFHPLLVHLPIGFLVLLFVLEVVSFLPRLKHTAGAVRLVLGLLIPVAAMSVICGLLLARSGGYDPVLVRWHQFTGIGVAVASGLLFALHRRGPVLAYRALLVVAFGLLLVASHLGGSLTHGSDYLTRYAPEPLRLLTGAKDGNKPSKTITTNRADRIVFTDIIQPILKENCVTCHGPEKSKAGLRLDSLAAILEGGESGPAIIPGKPGDTLLLKMVKLPPEHEDHMPPEGKPQPKADDLALIEWWVESGAPEAKTLGELHPTPKIARILEARLGQPAAAPPLVAPRPVAEIEPLLRALEVELGVAIGRLDEFEPWLQCNASIAGTNFTDASLARLAPLANNLQRLDLGGTAITDDGLAQVAAMKNLARLHLERCAISDAGLAQLAGLRQLEYLNLHDTAVSDEGLPALKALPNLRKIYLWQSRVTPGAARQLDKALTDQEQVQRWEQEIADLKANIEKQRVTVDLGTIPTAASNTNTAPANALCPVSGKPVDSAHTALHEGRRVAFCCADCKAKFEADPKPFLEKLNPSAKSADPKP